ncbi:hypothetical protein D1007_01968 [Hordeum vulgare]|nr:hypothetical protein D1007_01968 [Hordeum vulgare]
MSSCGVEGVGIECNHPLPHYPTRELNGQRGSRGIHSLLSLVRCNYDSPPLPNREKERHRSLLPLAASAGHALSPFLAFTIVPRDAVGMTSTRGAWVGSDVDEDHIEFLRHLSKLPPMEFVTVSIPRAENSPAPQADEVVVFTEHFARGFGFPTSDFFFNFPTPFGLQSHPLASNVVLELAAYVTLCKGFLGIEPRLDVWR